MPHSGYVSRDTLRRIFATPITKVEGDSIQPSGKGVRDARLAYRFSRARICPGLLFPSKYADYSRRQSRFCITSGRDTLSRAGKTEDGNLLFPHSYDVLFMSGGLILGVFKVAARGLSRRYAAPRRAARSYFPYNVARFRRKENLCAANDDSARTLVLATRSPRKPSIFQRFD